jgi:hypothetical protein
MSGRSITTHCANRLSPPVVIYLSWLNVDPSPSVGLTAGPMTVKSSRVRDPILPYMIFTRAHLTQPAHVLRRPLIEQSDAALRAVIDACRCYHPGCRAFD